MVEIGRRRRPQPVPAHILFDSLTNWRAPNARPWLLLLPDEQEPTVLAAAHPTLVEWSSLWPKRSELRIRFDIAAAGPGSFVTWTLSGPMNTDDASAVGHLRKRMNQLISGSLLLSYGQ